MGARGSKPDNFLPHIGLAPEQTRPKPAPGMSPRARKTWRSIVDSLPPGWFRKGSLPLLRAYCEAEAVHFEACKLITGKGLVGKIGSTVKANPAIGVQTAKASEMAMLATKLRLAVNAYRDKDNAGTHGREKPKSKRAGLMFGGRDTE